MKLSLGCTRWESGAFERSPFPGNAKELTVAPQTSTFMMWASTRICSATWQCSRSVPSHMSLTELRQAGWRVEWRLRLNDCMTWIGFSSALMCSLAVDEGLTDVIPEAIECRRKAVHVCKKDVLESNLPVSKATGHHAVSKTTGHHASHAQIEAVLNTLVVSKSLTRSCVAAACHHVAFGRRTARNQES